MGSVGGDADIRIGDGDGGVDGVDNVDSGVGWISNNNACVDRVDDGHRGVGG